jgi:hypothetical protein
MITMQNVENYTGNLYRKKQTNEFTDFSEDLFH